MTEERWQHIQNVFEAALPLSDAERPSYLEKACLGDPTLREEVNSLLAASSGQGRFDRLASRFEIEEAPEPEPATRIGPYRLLHALGQGGMGTVYLAERDDGQYTQRVALKVFHAGLHREQLIQRFMAERQILAQLEHPNIARLLFGGVTPDQRPYFALEYVEGEPITDYCDAQGLSINDRLRLFLDVCGAVQHAHRHLIVHRDLKPSNILVTEHQEVKLLDFGIAKLLNDTDVSTTPPLTETGLRLMTPEYASPEQVRGDVVTTATDVYQLGVLLYEVLSGRRPFQLPTRLFQDIERIICEEQPEKPSTAVIRAKDSDEAVSPEQVSRARNADVDRLRRQLGGDLDNIVLMAMHKEPARRYTSAEALADDLRRHLDGRPVRARPDLLAYRAVKFVRRHRLGVASAAFITILVLGFGVAMAVQASRIARERDRAQAEADKAEQVAEVLAGLFRASRPEEARGDTLTAYDLLARGIEDVEALSDQPDVQAQMLNTLGWSYQSLGQLDEAERLLTRGLALRRELYPHGHPDLAASLRTVAALFLEQGNYDEAEPLLEEALTIHRTHAEGDSTHVANLLDNLGVLHERRGNFAKAEQLHRKGLALYQHTLGEDHPDAITTLNNLAFVLQRQGHNDEAITGYLDVLDRLRHLHQGDHPHIAHTLNNLGTVYRQTRDYAAAEMVYLESLGVARRVFGDEHPAVAATLNNLGVVLRRLNRYDEAETFYREALAMRRRLLGEEHPAVLTTLNNLAVLHRVKGDYDTAETLFKDVIARQRRTLGVHPRTAASLHNLARLYQLRGRLADAEQFYREALAMQQQKLAPDHPNIVDTQIRLGEVLLQQEQWAEAESPLLESYRLFKDRFGEHHDNTTRVLDRLIYLYKGWGKVEEAEKYQALQAASKPSDVPAQGSE